MITPNERLISLDFDGVLTDPHALKSAELCRLGYDVAPAHTQRRYAIERLGVPLDVYECAAERANCKRLAEAPLTRGAAEALEALVGLAVRLIVVTARNLEQCESIHDFIARHRLPIHEVRSSYGGSKAAILAGAAPLLHVDDTPTHLQLIRSALPGIEPLLFQNAANAWWIAENPGELDVVAWPDVVRRARRCLKHLETSSLLGKEIGCRAS